MTAWAIGAPRRKTPPRLTMPWMWQSYKALEVGPSAGWWGPSLDYIEKTMDGYIYPPAHPNTKESLENVIAGFGWGIEFDVFTIRRRELAPTFIWKVYRMEVEKRNERLWLKFWRLGFKKIIR